MSKLLADREVSKVVARKARPPKPSDLLSNPSFRARFEETSAALEAAEFVRQMRKSATSANGSRGMGQGELAKLTGLSQPRISQIERGFGRDGVSYAVMRKIAYACGFDWGQLIRNAIKQSAKDTAAKAA